MQAVRATFFSLPRFSNCWYWAWITRVVTSGHQGGHIEHTAHIASSAFGLAVASFLATVIVHGSHAHQSCNFLAVHLAQFWQSASKSSGGHLAHAGSTAQDLAFAPARLFALSETAGSVPPGVSFPLSRWQ